MKVLIQTYLISIVGSCLYVLVTTGIYQVRRWWRQRRRLGSSGDIINESMAMRTFQNAPLHYKLALALIPLVNTFFAIFLLVVLWWELSYQWLRLGRWFVIRISKDPENMKFFKFKFWLTWIFFRHWVDFFLKRYEYDIIDKFGRNYFKRHDDENKEIKSESGQTVPEKEREPEQKGSSVADESDPEAPEHR